MKKISTLMLGFALGLTLMSGTATAVFGYDDKHDKKDDHKKH